jgi:2-polyprenyl-3-methyl-5-hydroxy-6-metoxy-1,4-benzoquinol methylase
MTHDIKNTLEYYNQSRTEMVSFLPEIYQRVLEIGCGTGNFKKLLKHNTEIWGVELNTEAAKHVKSKYSRVLVGDYSSVSDTIPEGYFDLVICNDIIEHIDNSDAFLQSISTKMKRGGYIVASIPNVRFWKNLFNLLILKDWEYVNEGVLDRTHLRFFTKKSIKRLFINHHFNIEMIKGINVPTNTGYLISSIVALISLGYYADIRFLQYGLRAKKIY